MPVGLQIEPLSLGGVREAGVDRAINHFIAVIDALHPYGSLIGAALTLLLFIVAYVLQRRARRIQALLAWQHYRDEVRGFADSAISVMSDAEALCEAKPELLPDFWQRYNHLLAQLSALRDRAKLVIPNLTPDLYGTHKAEAYRGLREAALDCLASAFTITTSIDWSRSGYNRAPLPLDAVPTDATHQAQKILWGLKRLPEPFPAEGPNGKGWSSKSAIVEAKRQFVSEAQKLIETRRWISLIRSIQP